MWSGVSNRDGDATQGPHTAHEDETVMNGAPIIGPPAALEIRV